MRIVVLITILFTGFGGWLQFPKRLIGSGRSVVPNGPSRYSVVVDYKILLSCRCSALYFLNHSSCTVALCCGAVWGEGDVLKVCTVSYFLGVSQYL